MPRPSSAPVPDADAQREQTLLAFLRWISLPGAPPPPPPPPPPPKRSRRQRG